jgi:dephospho-CoA kinase
MKVLGLTGPSGAGKGFVCALFARHGIPSIDADRVYHDLLVPPSQCLDALVERFGRSVLFPDGTLNRKALGGIVFADPAELAALNAITHRFVLEKIRLLLQAYAESDTPPAAVLVDAPTLYESGFDTECDRVIAVLADRAARKARILQRDSIPEEAAERRLSAQPDDAFYTARAHFVLHNEGDEKALEAQLAPILADVAEGAAV